MWTPLARLKRMAPVLAMSGAIALGGGAASAQESGQQLTLRGYPVAIHSGNCVEISQEPVLDLGFIFPRPFLGDEELGDELTRANFYEDGGDEKLGTDVAVLTGDIFGDGSTNFGLDLNANGTFDEDEVVGGAIVWSQRDDLDLDDLAADQDVDLGEDNDLRASPHTIVIHRSHVTDEDYLACGEIQGQAINGQVIVPFFPVTDQGMTGAAHVTTGDDGFFGIGGDGGQMEIHAWPRPMTLPSDLAAPTATPSPTPEPTNTPTPEPTNTPTPEPTNTPTPEPTSTPTPSPTPLVIEIPTEFTIEIHEGDFNPSEFRILADTDTELTVSNLTTENKTFVIEDLDVSLDLPAGETSSITLNAPVGEYEYSLQGDGDTSATGTLIVVEDDV